MTPTEQDNELREQIKTIIIGFDGGNWYDNKADSIMEAVLDWHNSQVEAVIKKPHILPQNAQHLESVKQGINFYHRQMRKRLDRLKGGE